MTADDTDDNAICQVEFLPENFLQGDGFRNKLRKKLEEALGSNSTVDENLVDYVSLLIYNQHAKEQFRNDLDAFFGPEKSRDFTNWLFEYLSKIIATNKQKRATEEAAEKQQPDFPAEDEVSVPPASASSDSKRMAVRSSSDKKPTAKSSRGSTRSSRKLYRRRRSRSRGDREKDKEGRRRSSRRARQRSRSRSKEKESRKSRKTKSSSTKKKRELLIEEHKSSPKPPDSISKPDSKTKRRRIICEDNQNVVIKVPTKEIKPKTIVISDPQPETGAAATTKNEKSAAPKENLAADPIKDEPTVTALKQEPEFVISFKGEDALTQKHHTGTHKRKFIQTGKIAESLPNKRSKTPSKPRSRPTGGVSPNLDEAEDAALVIINPEVARLALPPTSSSYPGRGRGRGLQPMLRRFSRRPFRYGRFRGYRGYRGYRGFRRGSRGGRGRGWGRGRGMFRNKVWVSSDYEDTTMKAPEDGLATKTPIAIEGSSPIPCRFDEFCERIGCMYTHPNRDAQAKIFKAQPMP